jgi:hypothetical protein
MAYANQRIRRKPLIYLDSSDYFNFSADNRPSDVRDVYEFLLDKVKRDSIDIAYSFFNVGELLREFDLKHYESRLTRAQVVMTLTRGLAFRFPPVDPNHPTSEKGHWFPDFDPPEIFNPDKLKERTKQEISQRLKHAGLSRQARRRAISKKALKEKILGLPAHQIPP